MGKLKYPGADHTAPVAVPEVEAEFIPGTVIPNYDAFEGWTAEQVLAWLNID